MLSKIPEGSSSTVPSSNPRGRSVRAQGPDSLITIPLPLGPAWPQAPVSPIAAQSFYSFSNWSGHGFQTLASAAEEGVGWRKWAPSVRIPVSPVVQHQGMHRESDLQLPIIVNFQL